jgi:hypothetical protein
LVRDPVADAVLRWQTTDASDAAWRAFDRSDWAWEFLRRNPCYQVEARSAVPGYLPVMALRDGTVLLRLRRRYPGAERWGLYAFADPEQRARNTYVFWHPSVWRRIVRARCQLTPDEDMPALRLAEFHAERSAVIGIDGELVVTMKVPGACVGLAARGWHLITQPAGVTFEVPNFDELATQFECFQLLQELRDAKFRKVSRSPTTLGEQRLHHKLIALDGDLAGASYREIAVKIYGERIVAQSWSSTSRYLKDRIRRLVINGHKLMNGRYLNLLR